ncbi:MAG: M6 family metalloprotease domain-containing protein [Prevotella sp.]|nr:M6 family metalloprotease domain-containing protein [Prevotella sp.]
MRKILLLCCMALTTLSLWAAKANPAPIIITQSDGTQVTLYQHGDEHFSWISTADGVLVIKVDNDFYVAEISKTGELKATKQLAHNSNMRSVTEDKAVKEQEAKKHLFFSTATRTIAQTRAQSIGTRKPAYFPHTGTPKVLTILVEFSDTVFSAQDPKATFTEYLNSDGPLKNRGLREDRNHGSVRQYFSSMSSGAFQPEFDVVGPFKLDKPSMYYGEDKNGNQDYNYMNLIKDACEAAKGTVDFSKYDSNGDNMVDLVYVIYAGWGQNTTGTSNDLWPKSSYFSEGRGPVFNGKNIGRFGISNELNYKPGQISSSTGKPLGKRINGIGLFCHEFSHTMGLPDFYPIDDTAKKDNQAMEYWDLMDGGEYTDQGYTPTPYTPWEKEVMGWATVKTIEDKEAKIELKAGEALKITSDNIDEYLILHNIQDEGWNYGLSRLGHGMLVYRINYGLDTVNMEDKVNDIYGKPGMTIVPADGFLMSSYSVVGDEKTKQAKHDEYLISHGGDPFPGTSNIDKLETVKLNLSTLTKPLYHITEEETTGNISFEYLQDLTANGIDGITIKEPQDNRIYTIDGRYVGTDRSTLPHGIYIQNRQKFVK